MNEALALTLGFLPKLLDALFQIVLYISPVIGGAFLLNLIFLLIFHIKAKDYFEFIVFGYINGKIITAKHKFTYFLWECVHKFARQYYWLRSKFTR